MNYYNPYYMIPYTNIANVAPRTGLLSSLLGGIRNINWSGIIDNTQRTLGLINQTIPVVKQVSPVMKNAKMMFRVMNEFKKIDEPSNNTNSNKNIDKTNYTPDKIEPQHNFGPTFFI